MSYKAIKHSKIKKSDYEKVQFEDVSDRNDLRLDTFKFFYRFFRTT